VTNILLLPLRCTHAFAQKTSAAAATLHSRFRAKDICCCRYVALMLSRKRHPAAAATLHSRFRAKDICCYRYVALTLSRKRHLLA